MPTTAFLTGSFAYGTPGPDSDIDLAVLIEPKLANVHNLLQQHADKQGDSKAESLMFGTRLNLLLFSDPEEFERWRRATDKLRARKPVTREEAIAAIEAEFDAAMQPEIDKIVAEEAARKAGEP